MHREGMKGGMMRDEAQVCTFTLICWKEMLLCAITGARQPDTQLTTSPSLLTL